MPAFKILIKLKLRILTGLVIKNLIITITKVYIGVHQDFFFRLVVAVYGKPPRTVRSRWSYIGCVRLQNFRSDLN